MDGRPGVERLEDGRKRAFCSLLPDVGFWFVRGGCWVVGQQLRWRNWLEVGWEQREV